MSRRLLVLILVPLCLSGLSGCVGGAGLPGYARPMGRQVQGNDVDALLAGDLVRYRKLTRSDFRSAEPPPRLAGYRELLGAATCCILVPEGPHKVHIRQTGPEQFEARPPDVEFVAYMDRGCSWWNDEQSLIPADYVLEHEQIHFAIYEIEARRLTGFHRRMHESAVGRGATAEDAAQRLSAEMIRERRASSARALERGLRFDEDTSDGVNYEAQAGWNTKIDRELAETAR